MDTSKKTLLISLSVSLVLGLAISLLTKYERQISEMGQEATKLEKRNNILSSKILDKNKQLEIQQAQMENQQKEIHSLQGLIKDKDASIYNLNEQLKKAKDKNKKLEEDMVSRGESSKGNWMTFQATYYTAYCPTGCIGITANGIDVSSSIYHKGMRIIAVDPTVVKLGSVVEVKTPSERFKAIAADTGGDIKGFRTDILVADRKTAYKLGRHNVQIRILN